MDVRREASARCATALVCSRVVAFLDDLPESREKPIDALPQTVVALAREIDADCGNAPNLLGRTN